MKSHWENIYENKEDTEVSWYQESPETSLNLIMKYHNTVHDKFIDVGAGNSNLTSELLGKGFNDLTALDISKNALNRTMKKLKEKSSLVNWVPSNILEFHTTEKFDIWHDRAVFHFLKSDEDVQQYINLVSQSINQNGHFILSTFSKDGPIKCSGLEISQYNIDELNQLFSHDFDLVESFTENHITPFNSNQDFIYTVWKKK